MKWVVEIEKGVIEFFWILGVDFLVKDKNGCGLLYVVVEGDDMWFREFME